MRQQALWESGCRPRESDHSLYRHGCDPPLSPVHSMLSRFRLLLVAWLIVWLITVPLFHLHLPDTTDRWSALHSGGAHTVFSADLPGEFSIHVHGNHRNHSDQLSQRVVNSPELAVVVCDEPDDRRIKTSISPCSLFRDADTLSVSSCLIARPAIFSLSQISCVITLARAPPFEAAV